MMIVGALIGTFIVPIAGLILLGGLNFDAIGSFAIGGAILFGVTSFLLPNKMKKVLFVLTLFQ